MSDKTSKKENRILACWAAVALGLLGYSIFLWTLGMVGPGFVFVLVQLPVAQMFGFSLLDAAKERVSGSQEGTP